MGANAQTTVQKFLSGAVLTAEQQNFSAATGVPVFATTVTRDAAFGGANKVLAEGQLAYIEATDVVQYYTGAAWATVGPAAAGKFIQVIYDSSYTEASTSSLTYADTTLTATITPTLDTSSVLVLISQNGVTKAADGSGEACVQLRLLRGATEIAMIAKELGFTNTNLYNEVAASIAVLDTPATTSATVYKTEFRQGRFAVASGEVQSNSARSTIILIEVGA